MRRLNREYLGHDHVTDVVTFDLGDKAQARPKRSSAQCLVPGALLGEIYICPAEAKRNAGLYGEPFERELLRYIAHGILHLLGRDDRTMAQRERMRREENKFLGRVGA